MNAADVEKLAGEGLVWARQIADRPKLEFDLDMVSFIDGFVRQQRLLGISEDKVTEYVVCLGSILGECVRAAYGGQWQRYGTEWKIDFGGGSQQRPYFVLLQAFEAPTAPSVLAWFKDVADAPGARKKAWWKVW